MDDSAQFMQWATQTLEHEEPVAIVTDDPLEGTFPSPTAPPPPIHHDVSNSVRCGPNHGSNSGPTSVPVMSWNFSPASAQPGSDGTMEDATPAAGRPYEPAMPDMAYGSQPTRRASAKSNAAPAAPVALAHIMAERKRREKINQRFIELATVIPDLKKMDKATILSDATRHVKQLQEKVKGLEAAGRGSNGRSAVQTVVHVKKPCYAAAVWDENGSPSSASSGSPAARYPLPEIEVRFSENDVMVRIVCDDAKGVVVRVLSDVEAGLHLSITHANVTVFTGSTLIITITAKLGNMDDSAQFMQWATQTLEHEEPVAIVTDDPLEGTFPSPTAPPPPIHHDVSNSVRCGPNHGSNSGPTSVPVMSWNFSPASAQPGSDGTMEDATPAAGRPYEPAMPDMAYGSQPTRRASAKSNAAPAAPVALAHIMAERKRREKINQRFIELATVIPDLKKMDKATILSDATRHVKQLQEKVKGLEAAGRGSNGRSAVQTVVHVKKPCYAAAVWDENGSPSSASSGSPAARYPLPEIEVRFSENDVMVRIVCDDAKGVVVRVLSDVEAGLHLSITHANVTVFTGSTLIITITAKMEEGFTVTVEDLVGRLNSVLQQHNSCTSTE